MKNYQVIFLDFFNNVSERFENVFWKEKVSDYIIFEEAVIFVILSNHLSWIPTL